MKNIKNIFAINGNGFRYMSGRFPYHVYYLNEEDEAQFSVIVFADDSQGAVSTIAGLVAFVNENGGDARELGDALMRDALIVNKLTIDALIPVDLELIPAETLLQDDQVKDPLLDNLKKSMNEAKERVENASPEAVKTSDSQAGDNVKDGENSSPGLKNATDGANNETSQVSGGNIPPPDPNQDDLKKAGDLDSTINS